MLDVIEYIIQLFSFPLGGLFTLGICFLATLLIRKVASSRVAAYIVSIVLSYLASYLMYWVPLWRESKSGGQYDSWALLVIHTWFLVGVCGAIMGDIYLNKKQSR